MNDSKTTICILSAAFNEGENIKVFYDAVKNIIQELPYEFSFCFVNDGSSDNTLSVIKNIVTNDSSVKYLSFSRNFGQQVALKAGIDAVFSDAIIMMDSDMQHAPELIPVLINAWKTKNVNMVNTIREEDQELTWFKRCSSKLFYKILNRLSDLQLEPGQADFRLIDKQVVQTIRNSKEHDVFLRGMIHWIGFQQTTINYKAQKRFAGQSKYTFSKMMSLALAGITSFSVKPLYSAIYIGFGFAFLAFLYLPYVIYSLATGTAVHGWSSVLITISFFGGLNLIIMGVLGIYIGKILIQNKERPLYIIQEENF